jgi:hypothetical protein
MNTPISADLPNDRKRHAWKGSRLGPSPAALKSPGVAGTSFLISNRTQPQNPNDTTPIANGAMNWYLSTVQANDPTAANYSAQGNSAPTVPESFKIAIYTALLSQETPQLTLFIHGLGNLFADAIWGTASLGANLAAFADYPGVVIGFDWPSYDENDSGLWYASLPYAFPPKGTSGTIRDNINGSRPAFANLLGFLSDLRNCIDGLTISLVCHSEGNYMAMLGLWGQKSVTFDHILMLAADINNGAFRTPASGLVGQAAGIAAAAADVTVYYTSNDDVLPMSLYEYEYDYHNPMYGGRLGSAGPAYNDGAQQANLYSVDCSSVINVRNFTYLQQQNIIPTNTDGGALTMHTSYLFIPQVIDDMAQLLTGVQPVGIANRTPAANARAFTMQLNNSLSTEPEEAQAQSRRYPDGAVLHK